MHALALLSTVMAYSSQRPSGLRKTVCESYLLAAATTSYDTMIVFEAVLITAVVVLGLTIYAFSTSSDFTSCGNCC